MLISSPSMGVFAGESGKQGCCADFVGGWLDGGIAMMGIRQL